MAPTPCSPSPVELCSGVDALYVSAQGTIPQTLLTELELGRADAEAAALPLAFELGGYPFKIQPTAFQKYRWSVAHELARFGFTASEHLPAVRIQPTAVALHSLGPRGLLLWIANVLDAAGIQASLHVARLDLHADWQNIEIKANERSNFVTYSDRRSLYEVGEEMSGLSFGKRGGKMFARIYDKTLQAREKGDDWWPDVWGARYDPDGQVLRIEFEFTRSGLVEFGIDTPEEALDRSSALWAYATGSWLSLRVPTNDETRSRWPIDPRWEQIARSSLAGGCAPAERIRAGQREGTLRTFRKLATGVLSSMAIPMGTSDLPDTLTAAEAELRLYEHISGREFADRVAEKRQRKLP